MARIASLAVTALLALFVLVTPTSADEAPWLIVLGVAQDAGYPHIGCRKECCRPAWADPKLRRGATCLALVDPVSKQRWMFECSPNFPAQLERLDEQYPVKARAPGLDGIFLTHAHIGHYTGLMHLGREALGGKNVPVFAMPRMRKFLKSNGPWSQLVGLENIQLKPLTANTTVKLNDRVSVTPWIVPHRDEFSETVGYVIEGPSKRVLFIPDIDKWEKWERKIEQVVEETDVSLLDGTFFSNGELPGRDMAEIPHPFISESLNRLGKLPPDQRAKVHFIHLNHSNPALQEGSDAQEEIRSRGFHMARELQRFSI